MSQNSLLLITVAALAIIQLAFHEARAQEGDPTSNRLSDLSLAAKRGSLEKIHEALGQGEKLDAQDANGVTPLCWAAMSGHADCVAALVKAGADVNGRNGDGATPLIAAAFFGRSEVVKTLLEHGARIDVVNNEGKGPLAVTEIHWETTHAKAKKIVIDLVRYQVRQGRKDSAEILREYGAAEEPGSLIGLAVVTMIAGVVGGVKWLSSGAEKK